jgi:YD repeat-containing protein
VIASKNEVLTYVYGAAYDPWGRVRKLTYPDGEKVTYAYDAAGQLASFRGMKDGREYRYLES